MGNDRTFQLGLLLRRSGPLSAAEIVRQLAISQPTVSRLIAAAGLQVIRIGRARATQYAAVRDLGKASARWPLYRIDVQGRPHRLGELRALAGGERFHFDAEPGRAMPALLHGDFADGLFPGLPWFLDDQRPQGFLGRAFARRVAADIGAPEDLARWQADDIVTGLLRHGHDLPGDLVLGEAALQRAMQLVLSMDGVLSHDERATRYPEYADAALRGELVGASAGGEQPKFIVRLDGNEGLRDVIVKFSDRDTSPAGARWRDLLHCERIAAEVLRSHGQHAAHTDVIEADGRSFLESTRFDRTPQSGRRGFVSLAAIDAAFHGHGRIDWWRYAPQLQRDGWIDADDARRLRLMGWFGTLIGNTDMHLGNAGLIPDDQQPLALAPAYDMLPMLFRPTSTGEVVERDLQVVLPTPEVSVDWNQGASMALAFWERVASADAVSDAFKALAARARRSLAVAIERFGD